MTDKAKMIIGCAVSAMFALIAWAALTAQWMFVPDIVIRGDAEAAATAAVYATVKPYFWLILAGALHLGVQAWYASNHPTIEDELWARVDKITSFSPIIVAVGTFLVMQMKGFLAGGYGATFMMMHISYMIIIAMATVYDVVPTLRHYAIIEKKKA